MIWFRYNKKKYVRTCRSLRNYMYCFFLNCTQLFSVGFHCQRSRFDNTVFRPRYFVKILNTSQKIFIYLFECWNNKRMRIKLHKDQLRHIRVIMTSQSTGFIRFSWNSYKILTLNNENGIRKYRAQASINEIFLYKLYCNIILSLLNFQSCRRLRSMFHRKKYTLKSSVFCQKFRYLTF